MSVGVIKIFCFLGDCALYTTTKTGNQQQANSDTSNVEKGFLEDKPPINKIKTATVEFSRKKFSNNRSNKSIN